jgi:hypothetical protein
MPPLRATANLEAKAEGKRSMLVKGKSQKMGMVV